VTEILSDAAASEAVQSVDTVLSPEPMQDTDAPARPDADRLFGAAADEVVSPFGSTVPEAPAAPVFNETTAAPEAPAFAETPVVPVTPVIPATPDIPETPVVPVTPVVPATPDIPETTAALGSDDSPTVQFFSSAEQMAVPEAPAAPVPPVPPATDTTEYTGPVAVPGNNNNGPRKLSENTIVEILDRNIDMTGKLLGSSWFILAMIGFAILTLGYVVDAVFNFINPVKIDLTWLADFYNDLGLDFNEISDLIYDNRLYGLIASIVLAIPMILSCIGGFIMIGNNKKRPIPSSGIGLAKTNLVFKLVIVIICAIASVSFMIASFLIGDKFFSEYFGQNSVTAFRLLMFFIALILIIVFLCFIFYYVGIIKTLSVAKKAGLEGKCPKNRVSVYAAVLNIIASVFMLIGFILSVLDISTVGDILNAVVTCGGIMYYFCVGMSMFRLKDYLTELPGIK
ncbi:MAG: hypothetical protein J6Y89_00285, partial [Lachnospiraceae bacterium]|nr:hypothetical protein [Lachnospiraceae bacterium]